MFVNISVKNAVLMMLSAASFFGLGTSEIKAVWGDYDTSFGNAGTFIDTKPYSYPNHMIVQPDGKILVTGATYLSNGKRRLMLRRWTANGGIDTTFGIGGTAVLNMPIHTDYEYEGGRMAMLSNDKIAVVGIVDFKFCVWVFNSNGYADTNFGNNGMKIMDEYDYFYARVGANGTKIILGVYHKNYKRIIIHQLNADGSNDTNFGSEGRSYTGIFHDTALSHEFDMVTGQSQNKITIGSISKHPQYGRIKRIERINQDGSIDFTFTPTQTEAALYDNFKNFAKLRNGDLVYSVSHKVGTESIRKLYKIDWNGTAIQTQWVDNHAHMLGAQSNGNIIVGNGSNYNIARYDTLFNFLDTADPTYGIHFIAASQKDNKMVFATVADQKLTLFRWLAN